MKLPKNKAYKQKKKNVSTFLTYRLFICNAAYSLKTLGTNNKYFRSAEKQNHKKLFGMSAIIPGRNKSLISWGKGT